MFSSMFCRLRRTDIRCLTTPLNFFLNIYFVTNINSTVQRDRMIFFSIVIAEFEVESV